ncbi:hypothetical protein DFS34DRAFT_688442 [Phlyctochytrium arcticum]|nr:hypothetical protein DFS34DRAFT_688442 [Phlyctochytrium arcticum]
MAANSPTPEELALDAAWRMNIILSTRNVYIGIFVVYLTFVITTAGWFVWRTRVDQALAKRSVFLTLLGFFGNLFISIPSLLLQAMRFPCVFILWGMYLGVTLTVFSLSARAWRLRYLFRSNQRKLTRVKDGAVNDERGKIIITKTAHIAPPADRYAHTHQPDNSQARDAELGGVWAESGAGLAATNIAAVPLGAVSSMALNSMVGGSTLGGSTVAGSVFGGSSLLSPNRILSTADVSNYGLKGKVGSMWSTLTASTAALSRSHFGLNNAMSHPAIPSINIENGDGTIMRDEPLPWTPGDLPGSGKKRRSSFPRFLGTWTGRGRSNTPKSQSGVKSDDEPNQRLAYILIAVMIVVIAYLTVVTIFSKPFSVAPFQYECTMAAWEMIPVLATMVGFFMLACPALCWWLWKDNDTYGIRRDLIAFAISGTFVAVMYGIEQTMFPSGRNYGETPLRLYFAASNWPVLGVAVGHITSIFLPLLRSYDCDPLAFIGRYFQRLYRAPSRESNNESDASNEKLDGPVRRKPAKKPTARAKKMANATPGTWALFASVLDDPESFEAFTDFSARDFAAENPLFYQEYRALMEKVRVAQSPSPGEGRLLQGITTGVAEEPPAPALQREPSSSQTPGRVPKSLFQTSTSKLDMSDKYPVFDFTTRPERTWKDKVIARMRNPLTGGGLAQSSRVGSLFGIHSRSQPILAPPPVAISEGGLLIPPHLKEEFRAFHRTFIAEGAPLAVNLPERMVEEITKQVGDGSRVLPLVSVFDEARTEVLNAMYDVFPRFLEVERDGVIKKLLRSAAKSKGGRRGTKDTLAT